MTEAITTAKMQKPKVGDIWYSEYHYADTIYDFYRVTAVSGRKITFEGLQKSGYGNYNGGDYFVRPTKDTNGTVFSKNWCGKPMKKGYSRMYPWKGDTMVEHHGMN